MFNRYMKVTAVAAMLAAGPATAEIDAGAYLAARTALSTSDFVTANRYFTQGLRRDPNNVLLLESAVSARAALGDFDRAADLTVRLQDLGQSGQISNLVLMANAAKSGDWDALFSALESGQTVSPLVDGLAQGWAFVGKGAVTKAVETFEELRETDGMDGFAMFHEALALAMVGDFEGADALLSSPGTRYTGRSALAHAQILSQLGRNSDAQALLNAVFGDTSDPTVLAVLDVLNEDKTLPYTMVQSATEGMAEVAYLVAQLVQQDAPDEYTLVHTRMAEYLNPGHTQAFLLSGSLLENLGQYGLASETYANIAPDDPAFSAAELGRIDVLRRAGKMDAAIEAAQNLTRSHGKLPATFDKLGDVLRFDDQFDAAIPAYTMALDLLSEDHLNRWLLLHKRAISYHLTDQWPLAEADFRAALVLNPTQPQVLNYLGYSLVERGEKLDEALEMIELAVQGAPDNGAIIDSLGWVLFQLGRYEEAVGYLERAASLEAVDPIVNDHLGDVYWAVGRTIEAHFQWHRALSFDPEPELAERIRRKLDIGLDAVLEEEGANPIQVANDDS